MSAASSPKGDFGLREAAQLLGLTERQVRGYVQEGFLRPERGPRGAYKFGFQDLVLLRTTKRLLDADVSPRRIRRTLAALRAKIPEGHPLSGVQIHVDGDEVVARDATGTWSPETGQSSFGFDEVRDAVVVSSLDSLPSASVDFDDDDLPFDEISVIPLAAPLPAHDEAGPMGCADWLELAETYQSERRPRQARDALRRALEHDPFESEARRRLARLLEREGRIDAAESHYRLARRVHPHEPDFAFEHGRLLAQLGELREALAAFEAAIELDPGFDEAFLGAAGVHDRLGNHAMADQLMKEARARRSDPPEE